MLMIISCITFAHTLVQGFAKRHDSADLQFDEISWREDNAIKYRFASYDQLYRARRDRMVVNLLETHNLYGSSAIEVKILLGEPDSSELFPDWDIAYWLGPDSRGAFGYCGSKWLLFKIDSSNNVIKYSVTTD
jgi:hypothetical protein